MSCDLSSILAGPSQTDHGCSVSRDETDGTAAVVFLLKHEVQRLQTLAFDQQTALATEHSLRTEAEAALRESEEHYRVLVENLADAVVISIGLTRTFVNQAFLKIHGLSDPSQALGGSLDQFILADDKQRVRELALARQRGEAAPNVYEYGIIRTDGEIRTLEASAVAISYGGKPASLAVLRDITERKTAERLLQEAHEQLERKIDERTAELSKANAILQEHLAELEETRAALQRSEERLERIVEGVAEAITMLDENGRIIYANAAAERILGLPRDLLVGRLYNDPAWKAFTLEGERITDENRAFSQVMRSSNSIYRRKYVLERPDGKRMFVSNTGAPLQDAKGATIGVVVLLSDVSTEHQLEEQSKTLTLLEDRQRIAMDLHDGVIQSLYGLGLNLSTQAIKEANKGTSTAMYQSVRQINDVIVQIRNYIFALRRSRWEEHGLSIGLEKLASEVIAATSIRPILRLSAHVDGLLRDDAVENMLQIAREAVSNVIRHASANTVVIGVALSEGRLILTVRDDGRGFSLEERNHHGQGLRNMRDRTKALGGELTISSIPGDGTGVRVEIPVRM